MKPGQPLLKNLKVDVRAELPEAGRKVDANEAGATAARGGLRSRRERAKRAHQITLNGLWSRVGLSKHWKSSIMAERW
jgi:hypothetical protein